MADNESIRDRVTRYILDATDEQVRAEDVRSDTSLRDELDLSSMQAITLVMDLETDGDVLALLDAKLGERGSE